MKEIVEMLLMLHEMGTDTYLQCKYAMQAVSRGNSTEKFVDKLFIVTDRHRPALIGMKEGGAA